VDPAKNDKVRWPGERKEPLVAKKNCSSQRTTTTNKGWGDHITVRERRGTRTTAKKKRAFGWLEKTLVQETIGQDLAEPRGGEGRVGEKGAMVQGSKIGSQHLPEETGKRIRAGQNFWPGGKQPN